MEKYADEQGVDKASLLYKLHDFGFRGTTCPEQAGIGGLAHLVNYRGTDTMIANLFGKLVYGTSMSGFSIPASEHSTMTSWGKNMEVDAVRNMFHKFPDGPVAVVMDQWDVYNACEHIWGDILHDDILRRNGTAVFRGDSGDPSTVVCKLLTILADKFGTTENRKGFKVLDPHVRLIQGDGVNKYSIEKIIQDAAKLGFSLDNLFFGMGGKLLQCLDRDTLKVAFKASHGIIDGVETMIYKDPITDPGKRSKKGRLAVCKGKDTGNIHTISELNTTDVVEGNLLQPVYRNGQLLKRWSMSDVRALAA